MLRGPLHNRAADGLCKACGEPFPCPDGFAIYEAVKRELEHPTRLASPVVADIVTPVVRPAPVRWEDLEDRADRCPRCLHWWVSHGVPTEPGYGCGIQRSSMDECDRGVYETCDCTFDEGNTATPRQVRIWHDDSSDPIPRASR